MYNTDGVVVDCVRVLKPEPIKSANSEQGGTRMQTASNLIQSAWREYAKLRIVFGNDHNLAMAEIDQSWPDEIASELDAAGDDWLMDAAWQIAGDDNGDDKLHAALCSGDTDLVIATLSAEQRSLLLALCTA
jgi:hypothetical protein